MNRSDRDPDAIDRIREDALTEQKPEWYSSPDVVGAGMNAKLQEQAARIASLEAQLAAAEAKHEETVQRTTRQLGTLSATKQRLELEIAAAQERERGLLTLIGDLEWIYDKEYCFNYCPECENVESSGHAAGCRIAAALAAAQQEGE